MYMNRMQGNKFDNTMHLDQFFVKSLIDNSNHLKVATTSHMIMWPQGSIVN